MKKILIEDIVVNDLLLKKVTLFNDKAKVILVSYGAGVYQYLYEDQDLIIVPETIEAYMNDLAFYGKTIGRTSGRLVVPSYRIEDQSYEVKPYLSAYTSLHGGKKGFSTQNFTLIKNTKDTATFRYVSKDLEEGYPGKLILDVHYILEDDGSLMIQYEATTTKDTLCNITNHVYFNLNQTEPTIFDQMIQLNASKYLDIDQNYLLKNISDVNQSPFDFKSLKPFKMPIQQMNETSFKGFDHTFIFDDLKDDEVKAIAYDKKQNLGVNTYTSYPAVVLYTHNDPACIPLNGPFDKDAFYSSFTLECQYEPGGIHHESLNHAILKKGETYQHFIKFEPFRK